MKRALLWIAPLVTPLPCFAQFAEAAVDFHEGRVAAALQVLEPLARDGDPPALYLLGVAHFSGRGVPEDRVKALQYFESAGLRGSPAAQCALGTIYYTGVGAPKDAAKAASWFQRSANQHFAPAQSRLAWLYETGEGVVRDAAKARSLRLPGDLPFPIFQISECGWEEPKNATEISARRFEEAIARGEPDAEFRRGDGYFREKRFADAATWFDKAARHGNVDAQFALATMFLADRGVPRDPAKATYWLEKAAEQWDLMAMLMLSRQDMQRAPVQAFKYAYLLEIARDPDAAAPSGGQFQEMTADQIADGTAAVQEFLRQHPRPEDAARRNRFAFD